MKMSPFRPEKFPEFSPRRRMVEWFDPRILALTGIQAGISQVFGTWADKRELEALLARNIHVSHANKKDEVWLDYVADLGDGFDPTYAIAWHLAKDQLTVDDHTDLMRGAYLIMGGDEVYPAPSVDRYRNQTMGPYAAAFPGPTTDESPQLLALPGNHDWYDGLTLFLRGFCAIENIGCWRTPQNRSYFAVQLPHHWWLWAVDSGLGGQIDEPQLRYFKQRKLDGGDRVILCWSTPAWADMQLRPAGYDALETFVNEAIIAREASVPLYLSGDSHHFAHYKSMDPEVHWITAGGGGAFLHPTHHLDERITLPAAEDGTSTALELTERWPSESASKKLLWRLLLFAWHNPRFLGFTAALHVILAWSIAIGARTPTDRFVDALHSLSFRDTVKGLLHNPFALVLATLVIAGFAGFAKPPAHGRNVYRIAGVVHGVFHVVLGLTLTFLASNWLESIDSNLWFTCAFVALVALVGGTASSELVGIYLLVTNLFLNMHDNEAFSALRHKGYKNFLRIHINKAGELEVYGIGLEKVGNRWQPEPATSAVMPCRRSDDVKPRLIMEKLIVGAQSGAPVGPVDPPV
jgi:hypothetical protein